MKGDNIMKKIIDMKEIIEKIKLNPKREIAKALLFAFPGLVLYVIMLWGKSK